MSIKVYTYIYIYLNVFTFNCNTIIFKLLNRFFYISDGEGDVLVVLKPDYIKYVLSRPDYFGKKKFFRRYFPLIGESVVAAEGETHRHQKNLLGKAFSTTQMKYYIPVFNKHAVVLAKVVTMLILKT